MLSPLNVHTTVNRKDRPYGLVLSEHCHINISQSLSCKILTLIFNLIGKVFVPSTQLSTHGSTIYPVHIYWDNCFHKVECDIVPNSRDFILLGKFWFSSIDVKFDTKSRSFIFSHIGVKLSNCGIILPRPNHKTNNFFGHRTIVF